MECKNMTDAKREEVMVTNADHAQLNDLISNSRSEIIKYAIALLHWVICEESLGNRIVSVDEENNHYKRIVIPRFIKQKDNASA